MTKVNALVLLDKEVKNIDYIRKKSCLYECLYRLMISCVKFLIKYAKSRPNIPYVFFKVAN